MSGIDIDKFISVKAELSGRTSGTSGRNARIVARPLMPTVFPSWSTSRRNILTILTPGCYCLCYWARIYSIFLLSEYLPEEEECEEDGEEETEEELDGSSPSPPAAAAAPGPGPSRL